MISYPVPRGELLQWRRNPEMELTCVCTHTHLPMIVQTCSYIWCHPPKCSHMHTTQHTHTHTHLNNVLLSRRGREWRCRVCCLKRPAHSYNKLFVKNKMYIIVCTQIQLEGPKQVLTSVCRRTGLHLNCQVGA